MASGIGGDDAKNGRRGLMRMTVGGSQLDRDGLYLPVSGCGGPCAHEPCMNTCTHVRSRV